MRLKISSHLPHTVSAIALATTFTTSALAQTDTQQQQAQEQNTAIECSTIADPAQRATCEETQGENAPAATGAPPAGTIVVTGSRITRPNFGTIQPSTVLSSQAIEQRGFVNAADALNELPQFGIPGSSPVGAGQGGAFGSGQSFVNFLGLGSQRTLLLVNGHRFVSSNSATIFGPTAAGQQVDLGLINTKLIERIETIAIGGAPIYGSDAIAGTINIILKRDFDGVDLDVQDGISQRGDAHNYRIRGVAGRNFMDGRANLTASAEYNRGEGLTYLDRDVTGEAPFYDACNPGSQFNQCLYPNGPRVNATTPGGVPLVFDIFGLSPQQRALFGIPFPVGVTNVGGNDLIFDDLGNLVPADYGLNPGGANNFSFFASGGNGFAYIYDTSQLLTDTERWNANLIGRYDITDKIRFFAEGWYAHTKGTNLRTQPEYNSGAFCAAGTNCGNLVLSVNNPFLSASERQLIIDSINNNFSDQNVFGVPQDYFYLSRANIDLSSGRASTSDNIYRVVAGVDGNFDALAGQWNWQIVGNRGVAKTKGKTTVINTQNFFNALGTITADNPNGVPCLAGLQNSEFPTLSSTCAPLNIFGYGQASRAAIDYVLSPLDRRATSKQFVVTADINGPLFRLPGGNLSVALGVEHREERVNDDPGAVLHGPDPDPLNDADGDGDPTNDAISYSQFVPSLPVVGKFHTNEIFGELNADIISPDNNITGIYRLEFQSAARYVKHSVAGGDVTWTVGSRYAPVKDVIFRGNFTHAIRSPAIQEAFVPTSTFFGFAVDPCDADELQNGPDPTTRQANCLAAGIPATYELNAPSTSFLQSTGGNPNLANEKSDAYSIGGVLTPTFIPRLSLSVDYISVKLKDAISAFSASQILNACYDAPTPASNSFCSLFTRNPPGPGNSANQVTFVETSFFNADQLRYRGIVAAWDWRALTPFLGRASTMSFSGSYQRLFELTTRAFGDQAPTNNDGTLGYPKNSFTATVNYLNGPLSLFTNVVYTGSVTQGVDEAENFREHQKLKAFAVTNAGFRIDVGERFRFSGNVENLFDVKPPFPVPAFGGAVTYFPGALGRYFRFGAGMRF